jgi:DNA helicase HerA-like ATPase
MAIFSPNPTEPLSTLEDDTGSISFVGRSKSIHKKYGREGALLLGRMVEQNYVGKYLYLDALAPHVIFVSGARGSGKSYTLGVIAEELTSKNPNVAVVIIDPIGIFWSMKYPNQEEKEINALIELGLQPRGVDNVKVFIPYGVRKTIPRETYDSTYAMKPADLTVEDWCLTFDIDRFSPRGLLLEKVIEEVCKGYETMDGGKAAPKENIYSIDDIINCLNESKEITSKAKGYKKDSRRALTSRFEAAKAWGVFTDEGTSLIELCREGEISVIDVSFLDEKVTSLIIGLLARKILDARKIATRKTALKRLATDMEEVLEAGVPPTWLFIDEAHTLIPSGQYKTAATDPLIEYVKQGRRPGCSLVFATQQPGAINTKVLSQLDILITHKLVFDDDLKAVFHRIPTLLPPEYERSRFVKTLPIGVALLGDRSDDTSRAFPIKIRPRFSQHEGRETRSVGFEEGMTREAVISALVQMVYKQLSERGRIHETKLDQLINTIKKRYKVEIDREEVVDALVRDKGCIMSNEYLVLPSALVGEEVAEEVVETLPKPEEIVEEMEQEEPALPAEGGALTVFNPRIEENLAREIVNRAKKTKFLGLFGTEENVEKFELKYFPIWRIEFDSSTGKAFRRSICFVDATRGEILAVGRNMRLAETRGVVSVLDMNDAKRKIVQHFLADNKPLDAKRLAKAIKNTQVTARNNAKELAEQGLLQVVRKEGDPVVRFNLMDAKAFDLPDNIVSPPFSTLETVFTLEEVSRPKLSNFLKPIIPEKDAREIPKMFAERVRIRGMSLIYRPVWEAKLVNQQKDGKSRVLRVDALNGCVMN